MIFSVRFINLLIFFILFFIQKIESRTFSAQVSLNKKCRQRLQDDNAFGDWRKDAPGVCRYISPNMIPEVPPFPLPSSVNGPDVIPRPAGAFPKVLPGFQVWEFFTGMNNSRIVRVAPNGDIFIAETAANRVRVLRADPGATSPNSNQIFYDKLNLPFGIAFYPPGSNPQWIYIANTNNVIRFPYQNGDMQARGDPQIIVPSLPTGGAHTTRDVAFSLDGKQMFVSVGSFSNVFENATFNETNRAQVNVYNPDGTGFRPYATGIRNPVGLAINPTTGNVWVSVNERDQIGDNLVPDYITHIEDGSFYGWPWYYIGANHDPRHGTEHIELQSRSIIPDVLLQAHSASLEMTFYTGNSFPAEYWGDAFASEHGSWNRGNRTGYKVIRVPMWNGIATGEYQDFMTGFVTDSGDVWGRPVGVAVAQDGALLVTDDGSNTLWRIAYVGNNATSSRTT